MLEAGYPQIVLSHLEAITDLLPEKISRDPLPLTIAQLKLVKTAIGVILNISLSFGVESHFFCSDLFIDAVFRGGPGSVDILGGAIDTVTPLDRHLPTWCLA